MNALTGGRAPAAPASSPAPVPASGGTGGTGRRFRLRGVTWLVWRQHRAAYWTVLACTAVFTAWMLYRNALMTDHFAEVGGSGAAEENRWEDSEPHLRALFDAARALGFVPVLAGVFLGAPLLADDLEKGTAKLALSQSVGRVRWLSVKLGLGALVIVASTSVLAAVFGRWWRQAASGGIVLPWASGHAFDNTGPVPMALALFTAAGGMAIGLLLRRTLLAMVVTLGFAVAVQFAWAGVRLGLGNTVTVTTRDGAGLAQFPDLPEGAHQLGSFHLTASGELLDTATCRTGPMEEPLTACLEAHRVVGWSVDYLPVSQMHGMQWLGAAVLLALTAAVTAFVFRRVRRHPL
ncbi:ABC transporter permease subunit [Streptomyces thermolineatus]|uniref:ABC transporter permease subunit n=1 Tax=Streptomyces thermolineatus TaxID=44033 RepID=UPI00384C609D